MSSGRPSASCTAFHGCVNSTCSAPSGATRKATRRPLRLPVTFITPLQSVPLAHTPRRPVPKLVVDVTTMTLVTPFDNAAAGSGRPALHRPIVFALPLHNRFRGITVREGVLLRGPAGWGEFSPFRDYGDADAVPWLASAREAVTEGWPEPVRDTVEVNTTVPVVSPERAHELVAASGCRTAKVKVADPRSSTTEDCRRVEAVRDALGPGGAIRVDANAAWDVDEAVTALR